MRNFCKECDSDIDDGQGNIVHTGGCSKHPNHAAVANIRQKRMREEERGEDPEVVLLPMQKASMRTLGQKEAWFEAETEMLFSKEQMKKALKFFLENALDIQGVEVVELRTSTKGTKVVFKRGGDEVV